MGSGIRNVSNPDGGSSLTSKFKSSAILYIGSNSQAKCQVQLL